MTCIVGLKHNNEIYIGGDSSGVKNLRDYHVRKDKKVFKNDKFLIGFTSSFRMGQLLMTAKFNKMKKQGITETDLEFMISKFIPFVMTLFKENGFVLHSEDGAVCGGEFLVGYNSELYKIDSNFAVAWLQNDFIAIGSGRAFSIGALHHMVGLGIGNPEEAVKQALVISEKCETNVKSPFTVLKL